MNTVQDFSPEQAYLPDLPNADENLRKLEDFLASLLVTIMPIVQGYWCKWQVILAPAHHAMVLAAQIVQSALLKNEVSISSKVIILLDCKVIRNHRKTWHFYIY